VNLVWATRGRSWGFRFLLDGGYPDPFRVYESAFSGTEGDRTVYRRSGTHVALRFPDPVGRRDGAGRVIPHDVIVLPPLADEIHTFDGGRKLVWPLLADAFARLWGFPRAPSPEDVRMAIGSGSGGLQNGDQAEGDSGAVRDEDCRRRLKTDPVATDENGPPRRR
jgi:hypothetical protein